jgi:hypothetical protein
VPVGFVHVVPYILEATTIDQFPALLRLIEGAKAFDALSSVVETATLPIGVAVLIPLNVDNPTAYSRLEVQVKA